MTLIGERAIRFVRRSGNNTRGVSMTFYRVSSSSSFPVKVNPASASDEMELDDNSSYRSESLLDMLIDTDELGFEPPQRGDYFAWGTRKFLVTHPAGGSVYEPHDTYGVSWRVHTLEVNPSAQEIVPVPPIDPPIDPPPTLSGVGYAPPGAGGYGPARGGGYGPPDG